MSKSNTFIETYQYNKKKCNNLINFFKKNKNLHLDGPIGFMDQVDYTRKKCTELHIYNKNLNKDLIHYVDFLSDCLKKYLNTYKYANETQSFSITEIIKIQYYKKNEGFFKYHFENGWQNSINRHLVFMTFLNDIDLKNGGGTEFMYQNMKFPCSKGLTLIWPAGWTHTHRGIVSSTKEKYIITGWYAFNE